MLQPGQHGSTFGGNPLACAIARTAMKVLIEEGMIENSAVMGARFLDRLGAIANDRIKQVRGRGLMLAVELHPEAGGAKRYCKKLKELGVLAKDTHENTIRLSPPLIIQDDQVAFIVEQLETALKT